MDDLPTRMRALLWEQTTMVMATDQGGRPWIASVFYAPAFEDGRLRITCALLATSQKLANLRANPLVALYVGPQEPTRWLQASGSARVLEDPGAVQPAMSALKLHAPASAVFIDRVPVVAIVIDIDEAKLTDLIGGKPPIETWSSPSDRP
ncbi:MAG: pyridoxamine 5'-phosphate oxidase family protein [Chloroflexi bacterium]|nr:pyridoxamine 5'-phosphate oxidase family protein [Chloroflexota bacterium]